jgi:23S rRNA-/tRNA-specific pseudouridylate synthase
MRYDRLMGMIIPNVNQMPQVLHEAAGWIALAKPAGWHSVAPGRRRKKEAATEGEAAGSPDPPDIETWLRQQFPWALDLPEAGLVHRLDQATSGCLLVAQSADQLQRLRGLLRGEVELAKVYLALVPSGLDQKGEFRLFFTSRHKGSTKATVRPSGEARHEGRATWRVLEQRSDADLVELRLIGPGRRHQLRAGLAHLGHPILGDVMYGGSAWDGGLALHAWRLAVDGQAVECPLPAHWSASPRSAHATAPPQAE